MMEPYVVVSPAVSNRSFTASRRPSGTSFGFAKKIPLSVGSAGSLPGGGCLNTYVILRRSGWRSAEGLTEAAGRSAKVGDEEMSDDVRWIRSYVLDEGGGSVGTVCISQATSPEAI